MIYCDVLRICLNKFYGLQWWSLVILPYDPEENMEASFYFSSVGTLLLSKMFPHMDLTQFDIKNKNKKQNSSPFAFTVITGIFGIYFYHHLFVSSVSFFLSLLSYCLSLPFPFSFWRTSSALSFTCSLNLHFCYYIFNFQKLFFPPNVPYFLFS